MRLVRLERLLENRFALCRLAFDTRQGLTPVFVCLRLLFFFMMDYRSSGGVHFKGRLAAGALDFKHAGSGLGGFGHTRILAQNEGGGGDPKKPMGYWTKVNCL